MIMHPSVYIHIYIYHNVYIYICVYIYIYTHCSLTGINIYKLLILAGIFPIFPNFSVSSVSLPQVGQALHAALGSKAGCCRMAWAEAQEGAAKAEAKRFQFSVGKNSRFFFNSEWYNQWYNQWV